jgi:hypothetical protein
LNRIDGSGRGTLTLSILLLFLATRAKKLFESLQVVVVLAIEDKDDTHRSCCVLQRANIEVIFGAFIIIVLPTCK